MSKARRRQQIVPLNPAESATLMKRVDDIARDFTGQFEELESAVGMLLIGRLFGWKVLVLIHNKRTIRKYEGILGIDIRTAFGDTGPLTYKSLGYDIAESLGQFWKVVSGNVRVENRREITK